MVDNEDLVPEEVVVMMASAPEHALALVSGLDAAGMGYRHGPAFPTVLELVSHVAASGVAVDAMIRRIYLDADAELPTAALHPTPETASPGEERGAVELLEDAARSRRRAVDLMRGMLQEDWARPVADPELGSMDLLGLCRRIAVHEMSHLSQLRNLISLLPQPGDLRPTA